MSVFGERAMTCERCHPEGAASRCQLPQRPWGATEGSVVTATGTRQFPDARRADVPRLVRELVAAGEDVFGVRVITSTLEEAYLEVVE